MAVFTADWCHLDKLPAHKLDAPAVGDFHELFGRDQ